LNSCLVVAEQEILTTNYDATNTHLVVEDS